MKPRNILTVGGLLFTAGMLTVAALARQQQAQSNTMNAREFEFRVRNDFFAGLAGDKAAMERAMKLCEETLAKEPKHAEALVWHGSGLLFRAGEMYRAGDYVKGGELWDRGLKEMDDAVALRPNSIAVLIPRGATLLGSYRFVPIPAQARAMAQKGVADYEKTLELEKATWSQRSVHARGEVLGALAQGWRALDDTGKMRQYLERIKVELPDSAYAARAKSLLATEQAASDLKITCLGCHTNYQ